MHVVSFALWYEMIKATVRAGAFVRAIEERTLSSLQSKPLERQGCNVIGY